MSASAPLSPTPPLSSFSAAVAARRRRRRASFFPTAAVEVWVPLLAAAYLVGSGGAAAGQTWRAWRLYATWRRQLGREGSGQAEVLPVAESYRAESWPGWAVWAPV